MKTRLHHPLLFLALISTPYLSTPESLAQRSPVSEESPTAPDRPKRDSSAGRKTEQHPVIRSMRAALGRAVMIEALEGRRTQLGHVLQTISAHLESNRYDSALVIDLLTFQAKIQVELGDLDSARLAVQEQQVRYRHDFGPKDFTKWLPQLVDRLRKGRQFDLAIFHLSEFIRIDPKSRAAAQYSLQLGDILVSKASPDGPYDQAIQQYDVVFEQFQFLHRDTAFEAKLRRGRMLWLNDQIDEAMKVFTELSKTAPEHIASTARHYPQILRGEPATDPAPIPR